MITVELARALLPTPAFWEPAAGDRFVIDAELLTGEVFWISDLTVEVQTYRDQSLLGFNGTTEWALDSVTLDQALWLPREDQLRELLGDRLEAVRRPEQGWEVTYAVKPGTAHRHRRRPRVRLRAGPAHPLTPLGRITGRVARPHPVTRLTAGPSGPGPRGRREDAMGVRKNAKFLSVTEQEDFVRACVLLKAEIVNPGAPAADQYSRWDELTGLHRMIQNAFSPLGLGINFGHGGLGSYSFLSWHRYFLLHVERLLQDKVPGVMIPYWDWTDPAPIMTDDLPRPERRLDRHHPPRVLRRHRAGRGRQHNAGAPWWPAGLAGWHLPPTYTINGGQWVGALRRRVSLPATLPSAIDLRDTLGRTTYSAFQRTSRPATAWPRATRCTTPCTAGSAVRQRRHRPHEPPRRLAARPVLLPAPLQHRPALGDVAGRRPRHRLPHSGGDVGHHRNDVMYPWTGGAAGYGSNVTIGAITMPDFTALGVQRNVDTLDHRALGYTYDTMPIIGVELDRSGSMTGTTPDPMTTTDPPVTKWVAATRGVSAFLQDCEVARSSGVAYVTAGVRTFRSLRRTASPPSSLRRRTAWSRPAPRSAAPASTPRCRCSPRTAVPRSRTR